MTRTPPVWVKITLAFLLFCILVGLFAIPLHHTFETSTPGVDLYIFWVAGRTLLLGGHNPYALEVTQAIQIGIYGHILEAGKDPMRFAYPPYALIALWPIIWMSFGWVQAIWLSFNLLFLAVCLRIALPRLPVFSLICVFCIYPFSFGLILGNFAILIGSILLLCLGRLIINERIPGWPEQIFLGILLAWATAKPQFVWFFVCILLLNALYKKQFIFIISFFSTILGLFSISFILLPNWPALWLNRLVEYAQNGPTYSPLKDYLSLFLPVGWISNLTPTIWLIILSISVWFTVRWIQKKLASTSLLAWAGAVIFILTPHGNGYEQIPFFIPLFLWIDQYSSQIKRVWLVFPILSILTWGLFVISQGPFPPAVDRLIYLFYLPWLAWMIFQPRARLLTV